MKKIGLSIVFFVLLISCSKEDSDNNVKAIDANYYGKWANVVLSKDKSNPNIWQEYYIFNEDNTFVKSRTDKGVTTSASGTFEIFTNEGRLNFRLNYTNHTNLIYSCTTGIGGTKELLYILNGYLENSARMCDYEASYEKVK